MVTLIARCKRRAGLVGDNSIPDTDWQEAISEMYGELHGIVADAGGRYYETEASITATGASSYTLPTDHLATIGIDRITSTTGGREPLDEIMMQERHLYAGQTGNGSFFAIVGQTIEMYPRPGSGTYKHLYIPQAADLSLVGPTTDVDLVTPDGESFLLYGVAVKIRSRSESSVEVEMIERDKAEGRLRSWAQQRSYITPRRQVEVGDHGRPSDWRV
jgi:hypothetical protein